MTALHMIYIASIAGAVLFFIAGASITALWRAREASQTSHREQVERASQGERIAGLERELDDVRVHGARLTRELEQARNLGTKLADELERERDDATRIVREYERIKNERATLATELERLRDQAALDGAPTTVRSTAEQMRARSDANARRDAAAKAAEIDRLRGEANAKAAELDRARREASVRAAELDRVRGEATSLAAELERVQAGTSARAAELEQARGEATALRHEREHDQARVRELERELQDRVHAARTLSTENEQLKGRVRDAEGLRAEYVRLRTATIESEFLKSEIARLEQELQTLRVDALGAPRARPVAITTEFEPLAKPGAGPGNATGTISESLHSVLERFADTGTRSLTVADMIGFHLASTGQDAQALAAYATLLAESAARAAQFVPFAKPCSIEIVDERGVRINVWPFDVAGDRLLLARLAVSAVEPARLDPSLAQLASILAPSAIAS